MSAWHGWFGPFGHEALVVLGVLPIAVLAVWLLARRRRAAGAPASQAWRRSLAEVGIVYGTVPFLWLTMLPGSRVGASSGAVSLTPLHDLVTMPMIEIVGNLLVFAALGFFAPLRSDALASLPRVLALAAFGSILIESAQYLVRPDRVTSIDDVLLNSAGAGLAALASRRVLGARPRARRPHLEAPVPPQPSVPRVLLG